MHMMLGHTLHATLAARKKELQRFLEPGGAAGTVRVISGAVPVQEQLATLERDMTKVRNIIQDQKNFKEHQFEDPIFKRKMLLEGVKKHDCTIALKERIDAALSNLSNQRKRGEALLELRASEYATKKEHLQVDVEWVVSESDVEDDVPLKASEKRWKPSRRWELTHMEQVDSVFNEELKNNQRSRDKVQKYGGTFSANADGRFHKHGKNTDLLAAQHETRTALRRLCAAFRRGYCRNEFMCTLRHAKTEEEEAEDHTYRNFMNSSKSQRCLTPGDSVPPWRF